VNSYRDSTFNLAEQPLPALSYVNASSHTPFLPTIAAKAFDTRRYYQPSSSAGRHPQRDPWWISPLHNRYIFVLRIVSTPTVSSESHQLDEDLIPGVGSRSILDCDVHIDTHNERHFPADNRSPRLLCSSSSSRTSSSNTTGSCPSPDSPWVLSCSAALSRELLVGTRPKHRVRERNILALHHQW
jgi:hypothetical protein